MDGFRWTIENQEGFLESINKKNIFAHAYLSFMPILLKANEFTISLVIDNKSTSLGQGIEFGTSSDNNNLIRFTLLSPLKEAEYLRFKMGYA